MCFKSSPVRYMLKMPTTTVNELRFRLFRAKKGEVESGQLPSCEDCLFMHCLRANFQTGVWPLEQYPKIPNPSGHGWTIEYGKPAIRWMIGLPASDATIEFLSCKCTSVCKLPNCQCLANGIKCTISCRLQDSNNWHEENNQVQDSQDYSDNEGLNCDIY